MQWTVTDQGLSDDEYGVMIGRFCPVHRGHEAMISAMAEEYGLHNAVVFIGSMNSPLSFRNIFSFQERETFLRMVLPPVIRIIGVPDFWNNEAWIHAVDTQLRFGGINPEKVTFFGGCEEDLDVLLSAGKRIKVISRFTGEQTPKICATELRDALLHDRGIKHLINPRIEDGVREAFQHNWERLRRQ